MSIQTPKQLAAGQRRSLASMQKKLIGMSAEWGDIDNCCMSFLSDLADRVKEVSDNLIDEGDE